MLFASDDDDVCWMLMPFFRYFPVQVGLEHNEFGPYDSQEFSHILHTEPFFLFHDLDLTELEAEVHSKIRDDLEIDMTGNGDWIEFPDYRTSPYRDDEEDSVEEDEDLTELENEGFNARVMASFWRSHYEKFLNYSIDWSQADWITRFVLQCTISRCDDQGSFHLKKLYPSSMYNLETIHGSSIKGRAKPNDVFWNEEGLEEGVLTSYVYPMGRRGAWRGRRGFVPLTVGTYKKGLSFEGLPRDEDTGEWWYDDLDLWDFWRGEIRNGNKLAQTSVDGDFGSFEREVYRDDFVFYKRYFAHKRIAFPRDKGFFSFFVTMEEEDDMDCFEMAWEDEDDFFIYNPYVKSTTGPFYAICPGEAKAFIPQVFRTPAWHGYPVPIDSKGWVYISWLWRFAKADSLSYSLNYQALTYGRGMLKHAGRRSFLSFFADTFGLFTQFYKGQRKRYILRPDHAPHFGRISKLNHDKRMFKSFGADLTYGFWRLFNIDTNIYEDMEGDDAPLADDFWDDEEHPMDCYEEGSEFYVDEAAEAAETFAITPGELGQGKALRHKNRQFTWINYQLKDPYYEEEPYPEAAFEYYLVGSSLPFLKSFEFFKTSYDANIKIPFVMDSMQIKLDRIEWERFPWNVYNFVGERDLNFEQINSVSKPYLFESFDYNYDCRKWWITDLVREWKNKNMAAGKATIEDLEEEKVKVLRVHQRRFRPKFARTFGFASENTLDLQSLSRDYLFLFLTRSVFSSYIQDEVCRSDSLSARYPQQRFIFQETLLAPYINLKSPVFSASWFSEVTKLFNNKKESVWTFLTNKLPYISLNRSKNIEGMRAFIPNKNEYFSYPTYLTTHEENSMIQHFAVSYLTMWQERLRFFTWQYRNMGTNYAGVLHKLKSGSLKCISRFDFSFSRFQKKTLFDVPHGFLSLKTEPSPVGRWIIFKTAAWGSEGYFTFAQWTRSSILYPLVWLSYNINFFSDIPFGFQWELSSWLFEIQALSMFYSFFIMLISWAFLGIHV